MTQGTGGTFSNRDARGHRLANAANPVQVQNFIIEAKFERTRRSDSLRQKRGHVLKKFTNSQLKLTDRKLSEMQWIVKFIFVGNCCRIVQCGLTEQPNHSNTVYYIYYVIIRLLNELILY